ncbi:MAG: flagellar biosynthetic protein FliO [Aureliella sp.]
MPLFYKNGKRTRNSLLFLGLAFAPGLAWGQQPNASLQNQVASPNAQYQHDAGISGSIVHQLRNRTSTAVAAPANPATSDPNRRGSYQQAGSFDSGGQASSRQRPQLRTPSIPDSNQLRTRAAEVSRVGSVSPAIYEQSSVPAYEDTASSEPAIRMRPMNSLRSQEPLEPAGFEEPLSLDSKLQQIRDTQQRNGQSFIEAEQAASQESKAASSATTQEIVAKIVINLAFVLAMGIGFIVLVRMWQMARKTQQTGATKDQKALRVREVLSLGGGVTLHVVDGPKNQFLVAVDSSGIKSVNVMDADFDDNMQMLNDDISVSSFQDALQSPRATMESLVGQLATREYQLQEEKASAATNQEPTITSARVRVPNSSLETSNTRTTADQDSKELDEKLISMLLKRSREAA